LDLVGRWFMYFCNRFSGFFPCSKKGILLLFNLTAAMQDHAFFMLKAMLHDVFFQQL
jgi:hypothetical protein